MVHAHNKMPEPKDDGKKKKKKRKKKKKKKKGAEEPKKPTSKGKLARIMKPADSVNILIKDVKDLSFSENAKYIAYRTHHKLDYDTTSLNIFKTSDQSKTKVDGDWTGVMKLSFDEQENRLAFLATADTAKAKNYGLKLLDLNSMKVQSMVDSTSNVFGEDEAVSKNFAPRFTKDGNYLYFGVAEKIKPEPKDTLLKSEKVELDIWHYADHRLQPQQLKELNRDEKKVNHYIYHFDSKTSVQLSNDTLRAYLNDDIQSTVLEEGNFYLLAESRYQYEGSDNWAYPNMTDYYLVEAKTGKSTLVKKGVYYGGDLSPTGRFFTYYDIEKHNHYVMDVSTMEEECITCKIDNVEWEDDVNGMPMPAYPNGIIGFSEGDQEVYVQSQYDVWGVDMYNGKVRSITDEKGKESGVEIRTRRFSYDSTFIDFDNVYFEGFDTKSKGTHFYRLAEGSQDTMLVELAYYHAKIMGLQRSKNKKTHVLRKMTAREYPDLHLTNTDFQNTRRLSVANPQQSEYVWPNVELISWTTPKGLELEGLLYTPDDYDVNKEYPLMVYFYELYTDRFHNHYIPKPTASIIYPTEYTSAGYVVFIPDVRYTEGHPAKSAYDCIVSGTDEVLRRLPNIDSTRMALQGQSWGGYQTAQLVTMTTRYKAAMAGAPVTNMFSAYGGIRWGSGLNRQFQYERTQSRIGKTIWEAPELYVENSPQFHLPNVETPLLIMHNDNDGAVPWYQGIELFTGLKRLGKKTWMLNYNGEEHNLMQNANRVDLSIRMRQFFDHYLLDKPAPKWLTDGLPATKKGKEMRY